MRNMKSLVATAAAIVMALPAIAGSIEIKDAYALAGSPSAKSGAAFMRLANSSDENDRLIAAETDAAMRTELHTHMMENGVAMMRQVEGGFDIPTGGTHDLARGGDHIMMMGLLNPIKDGDEITLTLIFEKAGAITITLPWKLGRD